MQRLALAAQRGAPENKPQGWRVFSIWIQWEGRRIFMSGGVRIVNGLCQFIAGGRGAANLSCLPFSQRLKAGMC